MTGNILANPLTLNFYHIDLPVGVTKFIGETEKNLCLILDVVD